MVCWLFHYDVLIINAGFPPPAWKGLARWIHGALESRCPRFCSSWWHFMANYRKIQPGRDVSLRQRHGCDRNAINGPHAWNIHRIRPAHGRVPRAPEGVYSFPRLRSARGLGYPARRVTRHKKFKKGWLFISIGYNYYTMSFEFDLNKSKSNKQKHGIDFIEAENLWEDPDWNEIPTKNID